MIQQPDYHRLSTLGLSAIIEVDYLHTILGNHLDQNLGLVSILFEVTAAR